MTFVERYCAKSETNKKLILILILSYNICKYAKKVNLAVCLLFRQYKVPS